MHFTLRYDLFEIEPVFDRCLVLPVFLVCVGTELDLGRSIA
jgi:hypothetical protein